MGLFRRRLDHGQVIALTGFPSRDGVASQRGQVGIYDD